MAAAVDGVTEQGARLALADDVDAGAVRGQTARAERAAVEGEEIAAVGAIPRDGQRRIDHEVGMGKRSGASGEADRVRGSSQTFSRTTLSGFHVCHRWLQSRCWPT